jgi:hypothetical protein
MLVTKKQNKAMKHEISTLVLFLLIVTSGYAQEKSKRQLKEEQREEKQKRIEAIIDAKEFDFHARIALPQGSRSVNLTTNPNYVKFRPDNIESYMPYFGTGYSGIGLSGDAGLKFEGKPEEFKVSKEKDSYQIKAVVKTNNDLYQLMLTVSFEGGASLYINSNNRSPISYTGEISEPAR